jgi:hypothetical protein
MNTRAPLPPHPLAHHRPIHPPGIHRILHGRCLTRMDNEELAYIRIEGFSEICRRIRLSDIHALILRPTHAGRWINVVLAIFATTFIWGLYATSEEAVAVVFLAGFLGFTLLFLLLNTWLGPTCRTYIYTGVQMIALREISRTRHATHLFSVLQPHVAQRQGIISETSSPALEVEPTVRDFT